MNKTLMMFPYGSGESGEHLEKVKVQWPPRPVATQPDFPFIVRLTVYPEAGHDVWTETYANPGPHALFLSHRRHHQEGGGQ